jgi:aspartate racemase
VKTIGLIGGMSWESTLHYYQSLNEQVKQRLGGLHSAKIVLYSVDFHDIELLQKTGQWEEAGALLADASRALEAAGADVLVLCTNTMHKVAPVIEVAVSIPFLHIADPTAEAIKRAGLQRVGLLGTRFTMEEDFYRGRLEARHRLDVLVPDAADREIVHNVIYDELCLGLIHESSRQAYRDIIARLVASGAQGIILGCTEIAMLISPADTLVPIFDTTQLHASCALEFALS